MGPHTTKLVASLAIVLFAATLALRPLNANDLFWHLAAGREILAHGAVPRTDPFSFSSDPGAWIDHEWLWQVAFQALYGALAAGRGPAPDLFANLGLILAGAALVALTFGLGARRLSRANVPAAAALVIGLVAAEVARARLMVRPETASMLFLALVLTILGMERKGWRRAVMLFGVTAVWANVHPAALLAPGIVLLHGMASLARSWWGRHHSVRPGGHDEGTGAGLSAAPRIASDSLRANVVEAGMCAFATLLNPYTWRLWTVPFTLSHLVKGATFYNPEWLRPPFGAFPLFYIGAGWLVIVLLADLRSRRVPDGSVLVALAFAAMSAQQMRHMGLFAVSLLFAGPALIVRAQLTRERLSRALAAPLPVTVAAVSALLAAGALLWGSWRDRPALALDPMRFPVPAAEWIARQEPGVRLYNDVQFGGYLIWRFFPKQQVFIDGRNELYAGLLPRLARIHAGELPYAAWRGLIADLAIEGAIVRYNPSRAGVVYPPRNPHETPLRGYRAWSSVLFPIQEWALVYFDDAAMVFVKRGGAAERWASSWEYHDLNPEDAAYLLEKAAQDPPFARSLREELRHRMGEAPRSRRAESLLEALGG